jgi:hypothetical protein
MVTMPRAPRGEPDTGPRHNWRIGSSRRGGLLLLGARPRLAGQLLIEHRHEQ